MIQINLVKHHARHLRAMSDDASVADDAVPDVAVIADAALLSDEDVPVQDRAVRDIIVRACNQRAVDDDARADNRVLA